MNRCQFNNTLSNRYLDPIGQQRSAIKKLNHNLFVGALFVGLLSSTVAVQAADTAAEAAAAFRASMGALSTGTTSTAQVKTADNTDRIGQLIANSSASATTPTQQATAPLPEAFKMAADLITTQLSGLPAPTVQVSQVTYIPTVLVPETRFSKQNTLDVTLIDDFITEVSPNARHYPPNFKNVSQRYNTKESIKEYEAWIRPYAENSNASFDVLIRAAKLNGMARNLDLGSDYAVRASNYVAKAIEQQPDSAEANFLYGMMLSEGGGFKESKKYLEKAAAQGYLEAEQSLAQAELLNDNRAGALTRLQRLNSQHPNNQSINQQLKIVENGDYYIWDLPVR